MAISRPFLLALLGVALLGATVFAVQNARNSADDSGTVAKQPAEQSAPAPAPTPEPAQASGKLTAKDAVAAILSPGEPVDSARFSIRYDTKELGGGREHDYGQIAGVFNSSGSGVPDFDIRVKNHDEIAAGRVKSNSNRHLVVADGKAYVGGTEQVYEVPAATVKNISTVRDAFDGPGADKVPQFDLNRWLTDVKVVGVEQVDGIDATHVTGKVSARKTAADIMRLARAEATQAGSQPDLPGNVQGMAQRAVKKAHFEAWVGADHVVRRMTLAVQFNAPKALREPGDSERWTANFDIRLSDVNDVETVEAPSNVASEPPVKGMGAKDAKDAQNALAVAGLAVDAPGGVVGATYSFMRLTRVAESTQVAKKVLRAVEQDKEVVVFFRNPRALDDDATAQSVKYLDAHTKKLAVYTDDVQNTRSYGKLLENLGVTQAPAIVFINRRGRASLVEGYVDGPSLAQVIADAR
jgi:hypothetical protein